MTLQLQLAGYSSLKLGPYAGSWVVNFWWGPMDEIKIHHWEIITSFLVPMLFQRLIFRDSLVSLNASPIVDLATTPPSPASYYITISINWGPLLIFHFCGNWGIDLSFIFGFDLIKLSLKTPLHCLVRPESHEAFDLAQKPLDFI